MSTVKIFLLYVPRSDLIIDRLLNESLNEDKRRELVLLILSLRFGDNLDPPDYKQFLEKLTEELTLFNAFGKKIFPCESEIETQTDCFQITVRYITFVPIKTV